MIYSFEAQAVRNLVEETKTAASHRVPYTGGDWGCAEQKTPGLVLVGDHGVYLMSNRSDWPEGEKPIVVYANECNPQVQGFDAWWSAKNSGFGADDGVEFLALPDVEQWIKNSAGEEYLKMDVNAQRVAFVIPAKKECLSIDGLSPRENTMKSLAEAYRDVIKASLHGAEPGEIRFDSKARTFRFAKVTETLRDEELRPDETTDLEENLDSEWRQIPGLEAAAATASGGESFNVRDITAIHAAARNLASAWMSYEIERFSRLFMESFTAVSVAPEGEQWAVYGQPCDEGRDPELIDLFEGEDQANAAAETLGKWVAESEDYRIRQ